MAITKQKKIEIVKNLKEKLSRAKSAIFVNFHGLNVADTNRLRRQLRSQHAGYTVAKKSLIRLVLKEQALAGEPPDLEGEIGMVYGDDQIIPAKEIASFAKDHKDNLKIIGGILEGKYLALSEVLALSKIASREVLLAKLARSLNAPMQNLVSVLSGPMRDLVSVLGQLKKNN